jgi:hypothetical protein
MGAKGKYSPEIIKEIYKYIEAGVPNRHAAQSVGISEDTFYEWLKIFPEFSEAIKKAHAKAVARNAINIQKASEKTWTASAWWLERREPADFGVKQKIEGLQGNQYNQFNVFNIDREKTEKLKKSFQEYMLDEKTQ